MRKLWLIVFKARGISMAYLWWPWPWGQTSANAAVTISLGSPGTQDGCAVSVVAHPPSRSQYAKYISLSAFCPRVLFSVLLKPPACSQYSGTFCRYRMLPCSWTSERGSEGFRLIFLCPVVCDHSLDGVPTGHSIQRAWFPQAGGTISSQGRALQGRNELPLPGPCSPLLPTLALSFAFIFSGSGSLSQLWIHQFFHPSTHTLLFT